MEKVSIIIAEKSPLMRAGLSYFIGKSDNLELNRELTNQKAALQAAVFGNADVFIVGDDFFDDFHSSIKKIKSKKRNIKIVVLLKNTSKPDFTADYYIHPDDAPEMLYEFLEYAQNNSTKMRKTQSSSVSEREKEIITQIALGKSNKQIADELFISIHTVVAHRKNIIKKLGIKTAPGLTVYAILHKLISLSDIENEAE